MTRRLMRLAKRPLGGFAAAYAAGAWLWLSGNLVLAAGLAGRLDRPTLALLAIAIAAGLVVIALMARPAWRAAAAAARNHPWLAGLLLLTIVLEAALGAAPPTARDAVIHHLAMPRLFIQAGRVLDVPFAVQSYYPQGVDMLYAIPLGLGVDRPAAWIHWGMGLLAAIVLAARARRWAGDRAGLLTALLFLSLPVVVTLSSAAYVDLALCMYTYMSIECFLRWCEAGQRGGNLALSALALGFALSVKYSALVVIAVVGGSILIETVRHADFRTVLRRAALLAPLVLLPAAPWLVRNAWLQGDPFYPLFPSLFRVESSLSEPLPPPLALRRIMYGESTLEIAALPIRVFTSGKEGDPRLFDGRLNPFLPVLVLAVLLAGGRGHPLRGGWAMGCMALLGIVLTLLVYGARVRYLVPFAGLLCPVAAASIPRDRLRMLLPWRLAPLLLFLAIAWNVFHLAKVFQDPVLLAYFSGRQSQEAYLTRKVPAFPLYETANRVVGDRGKVQLLFMGDQGYYLDVPYTYESYFSGRGLARALPGGPRAIEAYFRREGVTHLLVNGALLQSFLSGLSAPGATRAWETFRRARLTPLAANGPFILYALREPSVNQGVASGPGFKIAGGPADNR